MRLAVDIEAVYRKYIHKNLNHRERLAMELAISYTKTAEILTMDDISIKDEDTIKISGRDCKTIQKSIKHIETIDILD